jgi:hypothetical protein
MLDIIDKKTGKVIAVLMDDGTVIKKTDSKDDDIDRLVKEKLEEKNKGK